MRSILTLVTALLVPAMAWAQGGDSLEGVWRFTEIRLTGPNARTISPQVGFMMFTGGYFSLTVVTSDSPRPDEPDNFPTATSADELRAIWGPYMAQVGPYEVNDGIATLRAQAAKNPSGMEPGEFSGFSFAVEGNSLTMTEVRDEHGPSENPVTFVLSRVE